MSPWSLRSRRRRSFAQLAVVAGIVVGVAGGLSSAQATPVSEDAKALANAIESFSDRLASASDSLGDFGDLANNLPLTDLAPGDPGALDLSNVLKDAIGNLAATYANPAALAADIEALDTTTPGGVTIQFGAGPLPQDPVTFTDTSITIPIRAGRQVSEKLRFDFSTVEMNGGSLGIDFELSTTLTFNVDSGAITSAATAPPTALSLVPPAIDLCARATGTVDVFTARFGFTDVKVSTDDPATTATETASLHACAQVAFTDPDSVGGITLDEWTSHALTELATAGLVKGNPVGDDLDVTLHADASLVDGDAFASNTAADASVRFRKANLAAPGDPTTTTNVGPGLQAWLNITAGDVANGLTQFVASLAGAQGIGDAPLPLLKKKLTETFDGVKPLSDYAELLMNATVGCGTIPGSTDHFPTGFTDNLTTGTLVYCRGETQQTRDPNSVTWTVSAGVPAIVKANGSGGAANPTLAQDPSADAVFEMTAPGNFSAKVSWKSAGVDKSAIPRPGSAQELFERLADAAGLDDELANLGYDSATKSLTFRLKKESFDPPSVLVGAGIGDLLRNATNLAGLTETSGSLSADVSGIDFDVTFGVLLLEDTSDITPIRGTATAGSSGLTLADGGASFTDGINDPRLGQVLKKTSAPTGECTIASLTATTLTCAAGSGISWAPGDTYDVDGGLVDRFYLQVDPSAPELSVGAIDVTGNASLKGKVGFVEVEAPSAKNSFTIAKADASKPVLRLDINPVGPFTVAPAGAAATIPNAIGIGDLLFNLGKDRVSAECNLKASATLGIVAKVGTTELASGGVELDWPSAFKSQSCEPDFSTLDITADSDFDTSLRDFDPFPSVSGKHTGDGPNAHLLDDTKDFTKVGFTPGNPPSATGGNNLLNLTLRNKTTGASCKILTVAANQLGCTLSGGTRASGADHNQWLKGDEYEVEGNPLAWLGYILDNLDKLVEQVDQLDPGLTDKELPLVGISTKDLVGKIKSIKQTTDELRGSPLAQIDCTQNADGTNEEGFDLTQLPSGTKIHCAAITTVVPTAVEWSVVKNPGGLNAVGVGANKTSLDTVGASPSSRVEVTVGAPQVNVDGTPVLIAISTWQIKVEFTDAAGNHNTEFPISVPPQSLQELEKLIAQKLGVEGVLRLELLDLPAAGAGPRKSGTATAGVVADNVLADSGADFLSGGDQERVFVGNLLVNKDDKRYCTVTAVTATTVTCAAGSDMQWSVGDEYEVVGDNTKDLVVRLGVGFCSGGGLCEPDDRTVPALEAPLNVATGFADLVAVETAGEIQLNYDASAQLDVGISLKLGIPDVVVLDTSGVSLEASLDASDIGLSAALGPFSVKLGSAITDVDPDTEGDQPGIGIGKLGAKLALEQSGGDDVPNNRTKTFGGFLSSLDASFTGTTQECDEPAGNPVEAEGHACALLHVQASIGGVATPFKQPIKVQCNIGDDPLCQVTLPPNLQSLLNGEPLDWTLLLQILPQILKRLESSLDGAAQNVKLPLVGNALDAGANVVGTFNNQVVTPFSQLVNQFKEDADFDEDGDTDAHDFAKAAQKFVFDTLGPSSSAKLLRDTNGDGHVTIDDVVVTPLCGNPALVCQNGRGVIVAPLIRDFRVTFEIGQGITGQVPFDVGLKGLPLRLTGGVQGGGSWNLLVDFGLSLNEGPYVVANGKKGLSGTEKRPKDVDTTEPPDGEPDEWSVVKYLQDDDANFTSTVELGMWLKNTATGQGCRVTVIETKKLWCDDLGTTAVEGIDWNGEDGYELLARHAPDTPSGGAADPDAKPELVVEANVTMGDAPAACAGDQTAGLPAYLAGYSASDRCLKGQIAFLAVTVRDRDQALNCTTLSASNRQQTALCLSASLDFRKATGSRVTISDLLAGNLNVSPKLVGKANVDVRLRTGLNVNQSAGFPSVLGKFHLFWGFTVAPLEAKKLELADLEITFDGLTLDAGKFLSEFLAPMVKQVKDVTNPLMPVVETIQGEVPIISDLSKLVGQGPVTVLDLLEAISGNDLSLLRSILQMVRFVNSLPTDTNLLIPLGSGGQPGAFSVSGARAGGSPPLPQDADKGITPTSSGSNLMETLGGPGGYSGAKTAAAQCDRGSTFGVCGLTFPFLGDAGQIFGVMMGKDATLIHYDAGTFGAGAGFGFCFPPIVIGPVPVQICIGGSFRVEGRFAMGYDTSGLRKVLAGGTGTHLLDGIYLDDFDANGVDVPEVKFTGKVYAEGAVSVYVFKVGIRGEIIFTTGLNLHEDAPQDGKLRIEEIISRIFNPICLFDIEGKIEAALSAFVKIDLFITSVEFSIQIVKVTLLEFDLSVCNVKPVLARVEVDGSVERLVLQMGSLAERNKRGIASGEINETFTVRQMESYTSGPNAGKTRFSVSAFGIQQDYFLTTSKVGTANAKLIANADDGDDVISLLPGSAEGEQENPNEQKPPIPFTLRAEINGGPGDDEITTGDGNDVVNGNDGHDTISTGGGNDTIDGGSGNDTIDAGPGDDTSVRGGPGNDIVNGGPGADKLFGDEGDDVLNAGPGDSGTSVDELVGGPGNDTLNADGGGDRLWGDEGTLSFDCSQDGSTSGGLGGRDTLIGAAGNDQMHGGGGDDSLEGADGNDTMCGGGGNDEMAGGPGNDTMFGGGGDDNMVGGGGQDQMNGGAGRDYMLGDDGTLTRSGSSVVVSLVNSPGASDTMDGGSGRDFMWGQGGNDTMHGGEGNDEMRGGAGDDTMNGNGGHDEMHGEDGVDTMHGNAGNDYMRGGPGNDVMDGDDGNDEMYGDGGDDVMRGGANDDLIRGGGGDDYIEGNGNDSSALPLDDPANPLANVNFDLRLEKNAATGAWTKVGGNDGDVIYGDAGQDDIVGGSSTASADSGDTILGNTEQDVILGDNGTISRPGGVQPDGSVTRTVVLSDPGGTNPANSGGDWIQGNLGNDRIYAGGGGDLVHGDEGDDYIEGNGGSDGAGVLGGPPVAAIGLYGDAGQDDIIGGTSAASSGVQGGIADGADDIWGGMGHDVIAGDNADITRTGGGACGGWVCNTFRVPDVQNVVIRRVRIWDVATTAFTPPAGTSGGDTIGGQDGHDRIYGQGGDDHIRGGGNDDFVFGNDGDDTILGGDGQDDLVGGTGRTDSATPASAVDGRLDGADLILGEADFDAIAGDNARMVRKTTGASDDEGLWVANTFNAAVDRLVALMDVGVVGAPAGAGTSGNDRLLGGDADDVIYGQGGNDGISGGEGQDIIEGNANGSGEAPNPDPAAYPDWPAFAGDVIHGDGGADDIAGGTGWIYRMVGGVETGDPIVEGIRVGTDGRLDGGDAIFGDGGGDAIAGDNTVIERALDENGAWILDDSGGELVVRRIMRQRDVATVANPAPLTDGTSGADLIYGNDGVDVAYGQGGNDTIEGNAGDDHLEGNAGDDTIRGGEGRDDLIGGTGRTFSNVEASATDGRIDGDDTLHGGDGSGGVTDDDDDVIIGDNGTVDRVLGPLATAAARDRLPFNGPWSETTWNAPNVLRVVRLLDVAITGSTAPETNGTNGADTILGEAGDDVILGQGGDDAIHGGDGDDYIEGNGGADHVVGGLGQDDIAGGGSARQGVLDANRDGRFDDDRSGENLRDAADTIVGDEGDPAVGDGDVIAGDNARIQRLLDGSGAWREDPARGTTLRDVFLFDIRIVGDAEPGNADAGESGPDTIHGNGGNDILLGQDNGQPDTSAADAYGREDGGDGAPDCQDATGGPGTGTIVNGVEFPNGDNDGDKLPDIHDPECRVPNPAGDTIHGEDGQDYIEGNSGSDSLYGGAGEDDVVGGSSSNTGRLNVILPPADRDPGFEPGNLAEASKPNNLNDGHDYIEGNAEDDTLVGDNAFVDRYLGPGGAWVVIEGPGGGPYPQTGNPNPEPARAAWDPTHMVRRDVTTRAVREAAGAFGNDVVKGGDGKDDIYGLLGNDWLEGNMGEDAIVGDMGKIVSNQLGGPTPDELPDPSPLNQFIAPQMPFLGATINYGGMLKREVTLYAFDQSQPATVGIGHDVALGGEGNDWIHTGPGEDLANGNGGDDRIYLGDNHARVTSGARKAADNLLAHDRVDAGWGGTGHDIIFGGHGADYLDVRPRTTESAPGLFPASDPEIWFQVAGAEPSATGVVYGKDNFEGLDYLYGGWDQDVMQANEGDNGPAIGDRLLDWSGSFNGYYLCPATYGDWVSTRAIAPGLIAFLQALSQGGGAVQTATPGTSGFRETAIVFANEAKDNTRPVHADTPAHFTCGAGVEIP